MITHMKTNIIIALILLAGWSSFGQNDKMRERIKAQKVAFITDKLDLSSKEAQQFWPVFNEYDSKTQEIKHKELRSIRKSLRNSEDLSDQEANNLLDQLVSAETKLHDLRLQLISDLKTVLPPQKILKLKVADEEFNKQLFERLKEMREKRSRN